MPYIVKEVKSKEIKVGDSSTTILDLENTQAIAAEKEKNNKIGTLTYKDILEIKTKLGHLDFAKNLSYINDEKRIALIKEITEIENFYENIWERTLLELMFITGYYLKLIENEIFFEKIIKSSGDKFDYWFFNNVKYTMSKKIKDFYVDLCIQSAENSTLSIYEEDVTLKSKEIVGVIEFQHINEIKDILNEQWDKSYEIYLATKDKNEEKRKALIFD